MNTTEDITIIEEEEEKKPILSKQDLSKINLEELSPLTYEVISRQATINIGTIGKEEKRKKKKN